MMSHISTADRAQFSPQQYAELCRKVYGICGINLAGKVELVQARLSKRLTELRLNSYKQYFELLDNDQTGAEQVWMIDALTTNKTSFYREIQHFDFLRQQILPSLTDRRLRIWSAACSTGEEPYSIAVMLREELPQIEKWDVKILATDISTKVLRRAQAAVYDETTLAPVPSKLKQKYFPVENAAEKKRRVAPIVANMVRFARLNLMHEFPMRGPFDVIFCRNAMIYFDKPTQEKLVGRFYNLLRPGGYLLVGHAESLNGAAHDFRYIQPAVYQK